MELFASAPGLAVEESYVRLLNHLPGLAYRCRVDRTDPIVSERLEYTLEFVSKGSYDLLGIPAEDMVRNNNNTIERMMHPDDLQKTRRNIYDSIVAHQPYQVMYRVSLPSGRLKWIWDQGEGVFDADGELRYLEGLMMDISEQKFQELELKEENRQLKASVSNLYGLGNIVGKSEAMRRVYGLILKAAETDTNVIIYGETGSGKDLVAKAIHEYSARKGNYVPVNCGAIPEQLLESEFFGHEKGSFTGATSQKIGYFEMANGGTLFIDEVGEMPLSMQVKLLRVLQNQRFMRVGGTAEIISRFRLVAATNRDLRDEVAKGRFREDLFYRLSVVPLRVPPLRERREDIIGLAEAFAESYCQRYGRPSLRLTDAERACLLNYSWPGNVRELKNIIERAVILNAPLLELVSPSRATASGSGAGAFIIPDFPTIPELEERYLRYVLERTGGKVCGPDGAESLLHLKRSTIYLKLKKYGIIPSDFI